MKLAAIITLVGVALVVALLFIVPGLVPSDTYKTQIETRLTDALGRDVRIEGNVSLSTFPLIKAQAGRATIANPDGFSRDTLASMDGLEARIKLLPLLTRRVEIASFTLEQPDILLEKRADGVVNWQVGTPAATFEGESEPFARDGRFAALDPRLGTIRIMDGRVQYIDRTQDMDVTLSAIDASLSLPAMDRPLNLDGSMQIEGDALAFDLTLDTPRDFLDGQRATVAGMVRTDGIDFEVDGAFPASDALIFDGRVESTVEDMDLISELLPEPMRALDLLDRIVLTADLSTEMIERTASFENLDLSASGPNLEFGFQGRGRYDQAATLNGTYTVEGRDAARIAAVVAPDFDGADLISTFSSAGAVALNGTNLSVRDMTTTVRGPGLSGDIGGTLSRAGEALSADMSFDVTADDAGPLARRFAVDLPKDADVIGQVQAAGLLALAGERLRVSDLVLTTNGETLTSRYAGRAERVGETVTLDGRTSAVIPSLRALNAALETDIPYSDAVERISVESDLKGDLSTLTLSNLTATLSDGYLNGDYIGSAVYSDTLALDGQLSLAGESLRALARQSGTDLPQSTARGEVFENFAMGGRVSGMLEDLVLSDADIQVDDLSGTGRIGLNMDGPRPKLTGDLALSTVDLRPYMAAYNEQRPDGGIQPWSEAPLPSDALRTINADLTLSAESIALPRLSLGRTDATVTLQDGVLTTNAPDIALYGGSGRARFIMDASQGVPSIAVDAGLNELQAKSFLSAVAGFTQTEGTANTEISLRGQGDSQKAIIASLTGNGDFAVRDGAILGIDATEFLSGLQQALTTRALPGGIGKNKVTRFQSLAGRFDVTDGVARMDRFVLNGGNIEVEGSGQVDLGAQSLDVRFRPKTVGEQAGGLAAFGVPLRFSGPFGSAKPQLDTEFLGQVVQARATAEAQKLITGAIGGGETSSPVDNLLGSILGSRSGTEAPTPQTPAPGTPDANTRNDPETTDDAIPQEEEPSLEDALLELFGSDER